MGTLAPAVETRKVTPILPFSCSLAHLRRNLDPLTIMLISRLEPRISKPAVTALVAWLLAAFAARADAGEGIAGKAGPGELTVAVSGKTAATVAVSPSAGEWERRAADDLVRYIRSMSGAAPRLANTDASVGEALKGGGPVLVVGRAALEAEPSLRTALSRVAKPDPVLRADAIVLKRRGDRVYLAGNERRLPLLRGRRAAPALGLPLVHARPSSASAFPATRRSAVGDLDYAYAPPFEVRRYWLRWNGDSDRQARVHAPQLLQRRRGAQRPCPGHVHQGADPPGQDDVQRPDLRGPDGRARRQAGRSRRSRAGKDVCSGMEDGVYESDSPQDKELIALQYDKYFLAQSVHRRLHGLLQQGRRPPDEAAPRTARRRSAS